ncbi:integrase catalytic domain-containing protein [Trichonephila clavipes]|uniref:Integrase catalytic domain-containing protein n=1 Tax=Trichonephila clavipes TaxID=2585209 RepID=A0A8X6RB46_TRICX|nr:integrase catalytic domain-containing protein [Trichonephila clavipes]
MQFWPINGKGIVRKTVHDCIACFRQKPTGVDQIMRNLPSERVTPIPLSDNINEYEVLTPGHFIIGRLISAIPEPAILDISDNRLSRWQYTTKCVQTIWKRWKNDYLDHLQQRNKWQFEKNNVAAGCSVFLKENDLPPCKWAMARILEVIYGTDVIYLYSSSTVQVHDHLLAVLLVTPLMKRNPPLPSSKESSFIFVFVQVVRHHLQKLPFRYQRQRLELCHLQL